MKKFLIFLLLGSMTVKAQDLRLEVFSNNKETSSRELSKNDKKKMKEWVSKQSLPDVEIKAKASLVLKRTLEEYLQRETLCDLGLPSLFERYAFEENMIVNKSELPLFYIFLRDQNLIDDIFYRILRNTTDTSIGLAEAATEKYPRRPLNLYTSKNENTDVVKMYSAFKSWPDDVEYCSMGRYYNMITQMKWESTKDRDSQIHKLNYIALTKNVISTETYHKLEALRKHKVLDWHININGYIDVIRNAKDKLAQKIEILNSNTIVNEEYVSRKERLTRRGRLYKLFSSTQIMILSQLIEKTAKRMDARRVFLNFQYSDDPEDEGEIYVLSPMEQYRVSIKMLRKDMAEIMRSELFRGTGVEYEDLVASAFETGLIKSEELEHILKFEEFWNPTNPKWKTYASFAFSLAGTATFFLPPPWNVIAAIGLVVTQTKVMNKDDKPDSDDNWNVIL